MCNFVLCDILLPSGVINDDNFTVSEFLADIVDVNAVVYKKGKVDVLSNYRPISLLSIFDKLLEKNHMY